MAAQLTADQDAFYDDFTTQFFSADGELTVTEDQRKAAHALTDQASKAAALECMASFGSTDFREDLPNVTVPALVIHGDSDGIVPIEGSGQRTHEAIAGSQLVVIRPSSTSWPVGRRGVTHDPARSDCRPGRRVVESMDAITMLKQDHQAVEKLFKRFEATTDRALVERRKIVDQIIEELSMHAAIEEQLFYPVTRATVADVDDDVLEGLEEHHIVKWLLDELEHMDPADERFKAKVTVLIENVRHHVQEEEDDYFPKVRSELGRNDLADLGDAMEDARKSAPTHPHPKAPDTPPGNIIAGNAAGVVDRVADTVSGLAQGGVSIAQDLIARFTGRAKPRTSPTGSPAAKKTAATAKRAAS